MTAAATPFSRQHTAEYKAEAFAAISSWVICSIGMMVFNKLAIEYMELSCTLVALQMLVTVLFMTVCCWSSLHVGSWYDALRWSIIGPLFAGVLLSSMFALKGAPMSLVITFRGLAPIFGLCVEVFYPNALEVDRYMVLSLMVLLFGVLLYCKDVPVGKGYYSAIGWVMLNNGFIVADRLLQRYFLAKDYNPVDLSKPTLTLLLNLTGLPFIMLFGFMHQEHIAIPTVIPQISTVGYTWIAASCLVGVGISYAGVWAQGLINATTFLVLGTVNKFAVILIEVFIMHEKAITPLQVFATFVTIVAGVMYGKARENLMQQEENKMAEKDPLLPKKGP